MDPRLEIKIKEAITFSKNQETDPLEQLIKEELKKKQIRKEKKKERKKRQNQWKKTLGTIKEADSFAKEKPPLIKINEDIKPFNEIRAEDVGLASLYQLERWQEESGVTIDNITKEGNDALLSDLSQDKDGVSKETEEKIKKLNDTIKLSSDITELVNKKKKKKPAKTKKEVNQNGTAMPDEQVKKATEIKEESRKEGFFKKKKSCSCTKEKEQPVKGTRSASNFNAKKGKKENKSIAKSLLEEEEKLQALITQKENEFQAELEAKLKEKSYQAEQSKEKDETDLILELFQKKELPTYYYKLTLLKRSAIQTQFSNYNLIQKMNKMIEFILFSIYPSGRFSKLIVSNNPNDGFIKLIIQTKFYFEEKEEEKEEEEEEEEEKEEDEMSVTASTLPKKILKLFQINDNCGIKFDTDADIEMQAKSIVSRARKTEITVDLIGQLEGIFKKTVTQANFSKQFYFVIEQLYLLCYQLGFFLENSIYKSKEHCGHTRRALLWSFQQAMIKKEKAIETALNKLYGASEAGIFSSISSDPNTGNIFIGIKKNEKTKCKYLPAKQKLSSEHPYLNGKFQHDEINNIFSENDSLRNFILKLRGDCEVTLHSPQASDAWKIIANDFLPIWLVIKPEAERKILLKKESYGHSSSSSISTSSFSQFSKASTVSSMPRNTKQEEEEEENLQQKRLVL